MPILGKKIKKSSHLSLIFFLSFLFFHFLFLDSLIFGAITCFTGFLGVITGAGATKWCRSKTQRADPLVCAVGMLGSAIFICLIFVAAKSSIVGAYVSKVLSIWQPLPNSFRAGCIVPCRKPGMFSLPF